MTTMSVLNEFAAYARWRGLALVLAGLTCAVFQVDASEAQWKPTKPIEFVVMAGKGGGADNAVRFIVDMIQKESLTSDSFNVVNIAGGSGADALVHMKKKTGDPHTIMFTLNSFFTTPLDRPEIGVDITQFAPIGRLAEDVFVLWVSTQREDIKTIGDFVLAARQKGKEWVMAGTGTGAEDHLLTDFLNATYKLNMTYRAFKGGGEVAQQLADGLADSTVNNPSETAKLLAAGKVKPIVVITPKRLDIYNATPALRETGMDFFYYMQRAVVGPPGMAPEVQRYYQDFFQRVFNSKSWQAYRAKNSLHGEFISGDKLRQYWAAQREKHARWKMALEIMKPK